MQEAVDGVSALVASELRADLDNGIGRLEMARR
jgi:hypothetical protein